MDESKFSSLKFGHAESVEEAATLMTQSFKYRQEVVPLKGLSIDEEGMIKVNNRLHPTTVTGLQGICKRLHIPDPFARRIPYDLLQTNVSRLIAEAEGRLLIASIREEDDAIVNFSNETIVSPPIEMILDSIPDFGLTPKGKTRFTMSDYGVDIELINDLDLVREPVRNDPVSYGMRIVHSSNGFWSTKANILIYVLRCTNGAVMSSSFGEVKLKIKPEHDIQHAFNRFKKQLQELKPNFEHIDQVLNRSVEEVLTDEAVFKLHSKFKSLELDKSTSYELIGVEEDLGDELVNTVKQRYRKNRKAGPFDDKEGPKKVPGLTYYPVFDRMSEYALTCRHNIRKDLQELSGSFLMYMFN